MSKFFFKFFVISFSVIFFAIIFLTYFGIETDKFDNLIKNKINKVNQNIKLSFNGTKIHINAVELNLIVKLQNPKVIIRNDEIILSKINLFLPLKSFFMSDFPLKKANIAFAKNDIKDLTKITNIFLPKFVNKKLKKIFHEGSLEGEFTIPFQPDGKIGKDYEFSGKISGAEINLNKELSIKKLTTDINHKKKEGNDIFNIKIEKGYIYNLELTGSTINLKSQKSGTKIISSINTKGELDSSKIKKISKLLSLNINFLNSINGKINLKTNINFDLSKSLKVNNLIYSIDGDIPYLELLTNDTSFLKEFLPDFESKIVLKDNKINLINSKNNNTAEFSGNIKVKNNFDKFKIKNIYDYKKKSFLTNGNINLTNSQVQLSKLNYYKREKKKSHLDFDVNFVFDSYYNINKLDLFENKSYIYLSNVNLNKNLEIENFKKIEVKTYNNEIENNDFFIEKSKKTIIEGKVFDSQPLLKSLYKKSDKETFSKKFSTEIKINFDKTLTGTSDDVFDFAMIASINKGSFDKLSLKGVFSENEIVEMSIYTENEHKKTLQVFSDRARPFVKNFDFIEGFEGGSLEYESFISKESVNSNLKIMDFKVSKVPALAKLLTLASLQGIADTLSGEGIRFESFEMQSRTEGNVMNIEDALAIGPAVSILLDGYVDKGKVVSLRGTLVPATKLNSIIASIPVVGDILVGKKTGDGVVGVSFKMKGPPKNIKTTVNPIKTLTPRFIVRAIEQIKKKEKTK